MLDTLPFSILFGYSHQLKQSVDTSAVTGATEMLMSPAVASGDALLVEETTGPEMGCVGGTPRVELACHTSRANSRVRLDSRVLDSWVEFDS